MNPTRLTFLLAFLMGVVLSFSWGVMGVVFSQDSGLNPLPLWRFEDYKEFHKREHQLIAEALAAAKVADGLRLDRLNELRQEVEEDRKLYSTRDSQGDLERRVNILEIHGAAAGAANFYVMGGIGVFFVVLQIILKVIPIGQKEKQ